MVLWVLAWIDRVNIGFVKLTMLDDLKWSEAVYGLGAGIFFLGYFFFEVPSNLLLQKIGARKTIMRITIGWGLISIAMMFVTDAGDVLLPALPARRVRGRLLPRHHPVPDLLVPERPARQGLRHVHVGVGARRRDRRPAGRHHHDVAERRQRLGRAGSGCSCSKACRR